MAGLDSFEQVTLNPEFIKLPGKLASREPTWIIMPLEIIQLFQNDRWNYDVVFLESFQAVGRIEDDVGIDNEIFQ